MTRPPAAAPCDNSNSSGAMTAMRMLLDNKASRREILLRLMDKTEREETSRRDIRRWGGGDADGGLSLALTSGALLSGVSTSK